MLKIAPSILSADFSSLAEQVKQVEDAGVDYLHLDIMDGHFVPNITFGPSVVAALRDKSGLVFDVHLMIEDPDRYLANFRQAGADLITVHVEACTHLHRTIQDIKELGAKVGVALNPATPLVTVECILHEVDLVLIMSVNPGFGGQKFLPLAVEKVRGLRSILEAEGLDIEIEVDGGINHQTAPLVAKAGANVLVAGSAIFGTSDIGRAVKELRASASQ